MADSSLTCLMFDLDGTLVDSAPSILSGFAHVLDEAGVAPRGPLDSSIIGPPLMDTLSLLSGVTEPDQLQQMAAGFKRYYDSTGCLEGLPYPGVGEALQALHASGLVLHLATNKRHLPTVKMLDHLGWSQWFTSVYALDLPGRAFASKARMLEAQLADFGIDKGSAWYVGDRDEDHHAAAANGIGFVGVSWGYGQFDTDGHPLVHSLDDLLAWAGRQR